MKASTKLFLSSTGIFICGIIKGYAPTVLDRPFDVSSFLVITGIALIVLLIGLIKYLTKNTAKKIYNTSENNSAKTNPQQSNHTIIFSQRKIMTCGVPADYFFQGDKKNKCAELPLLKPLKIDIEDALKNGVLGKNSWEGSKCVFIAESDKYSFYNYGCYPDGSGGCTLRQSKSKPKEIVFFGKARCYSCVFHNHLLQVSRSAYGSELYLYTKNIESGNEKIYPWFGKYAIPTDRGSRYNQDTILGMQVDDESDSVIISVNRQYYINPTPNDIESICNADTAYIIKITFNGNDFNAIADFSDLNVELVFENIY